jgi:hypothetical protein
VIRHVSEEEFLAHYGILRKSGRYPWGSGETQSARNKTFLSTVDELRKSGMKDPKIAEGFGMTIDSASSTFFYCCQSAASGEDPY